jgi:predicted membrane-bound mannosyltransferase
LYALLLTLVYCAIPYKTPWAFLGAWHALVLLAAIGWGALLQRARSSALRRLLLLVIALATLHLGVQAWRGATRFGADPRNPYVYAHTSSGFMQLVERLQTLAQIAPHGQATLVQVIAPEYWPLPWYLRAWQQVGYYATMPAALPAPLIIADPAQAPQLLPRLPGYVTEFYALRPGVLLELYIAPDLFHALLRARGTTP